ncbi:aa3-type cytochrome oxidase subunit IV [Streptomyces pinistramenti]|uniref:aa3-type cytochrome oxidase subunit IV n=1 Tax=Streptomyces pinistramenti TaxID=2884812 RepID=UPI001D086FAC|nr:cytochrome c oxidase subunit 4 [Streptomyces pinistramenti]MCB5906234.1 cytochrome c oxidase subunit 4 [Streptomyces pinistramenti]
MKAESFVFAGVTLFFAITATVYGWLAREPAGLAALIVAFLMSALISFFFWTQHVRRGQRLQDRKQVRIEEAAGPLGNFSPRSYYPVLTAAGSALLGLGIVYGLWLFLIGVGVLAAGIAGFTFQHNDLGS